VPSARISSADKNLAATALAPVGKDAIWSTTPGRTLYRRCPRSLSTTPTPTSGTSQLSSSATGTALASFLST
jgi:hypothetical protein